MTNETKIDDSLIRTMQIIAGALIGGVTIFAATAVLETGALDQPSAGQTLASIAAGAVLLVMVPFMVIPGYFSASATNTEIDETLSHEHSELFEHCGVYQTRMIIRFALLEGVAFFNTVALIAEHNWWSLAIVGVLVMAMLAMFPTRTKVEYFVEQQQMESNL
jgi:hypothetical protein